MTKIAFFLPDRLFQLVHVPFEQRMVLVCGQSGTKPRRLHPRTSIRAVRLEIVLFDLAVSTQPYISPLWGSTHEEGFL